MRLSSPGVLVFFAVSSGAVLLACGGKTPAAPTPPPSQPSPNTPTVTVTSISVGVAGNAPATLAPGDKLQLFAQAVSSDGSTADVTNLAVWQSSNPVVATVAPTGIVTAAALGALDVTATYQNRTGSLHAEVQPLGCRATLDPESIVFSALETSASVRVTTTRSDCRWTVRSDASWLPVRSDPGRSGNGSFSYEVRGNNSFEPRDANLIVTITDGPSVVHRVHQERAVSCVYQVAPAKLTFDARGGVGQFQVTTIPGDCQWKITDTWSSVHITSATTGKGAGTVTYTVERNGFPFDRPFRVQGLSGVNPPAVHIVSIVP